MREFSLQAYEALLTAILGTGREIFTLREFFSRRPLPPAFFILRHDVDRRPERALRMAEAERSHGVRSTYYFRPTPRVFRPEIVLSISAMGHEIGYHYEVLDKARGEPGPAARIFEQELAEMRALVEVKTASMHGNPLSPWDNRDLWKHHALSRFGLIGEAYVSITDPDIAYATDTGRGWNRSTLNLRDRFTAGSVGTMPSFPSTWDLIQALNDPGYRKVYLQVHPNRWTSGVLEWLGQWGEDLLLNGAKRFLMRAGIRRSVE
ncbi:MAG: hypothetical protein AB1512_26690 [Thermodesulfobacteriota bacterium]